MARWFSPVLRFSMGFFFDSRYLQGRFFDNRWLGWRWAWRSIWTQKLLGFNRRIPWPVSPMNIISNSQNIHFHPDDLNNFQAFGCYFQCNSAQIYIGRGTYIAPNVGIITSNHDPANVDLHLPGKDVVIGEKCWIGMNAVILPGVILGSHVVVGAGAVVTKSFPEGNCVVAGNPASVIRKLSDGNSGTQELVMEGD